MKGLFAGAKNTAGSESEEVKSDFEICAENIMNCTVEFPVARINESKSEMMSFKQIFELAKARKKGVVISITPGPFTEEGAPEGWGNNELALGCTPQLNALQGSFDKLDSDVYAANSHNSKYQCEGKQGNGLLKFKNLPNLKMISISPELSELLKLPTIAKGSPYLARVSFAFKFDGDKIICKVFQLKSPVNPTTAQEHVDQIAKFISPQLEVEKTAVRSLSSAPAASQ